MIIGKAIADAFENLKITVNNKEANINCTYGNKQALTRFIEECNKRKHFKYPLIFYVISKTEDTENGSIKCETQIAIITKTNPLWLSKERTLNTFNEVIEPIYQLLIKTIDKHNSLRFLGDIGKRLTYEDMPNWGVVNNSISGDISSNSEITDYVDVRLIDVNIELLKLKC